MSQLLLFYLEILFFQFFSNFSCLGILRQRHVKVIAVWSCRELELWVEQQEVLAIFIKSREKIFILFIYSMSALLGLLNIKSAFLIWSGIMFGEREWVIARVVETRSLFMTNTLTATLPPRDKRPLCIVLDGCYQVFREYFKKFMRSLIKKRKLRASIYLMVIQFT